MVIPWWNATVLESIFFGRSKYFYVVFYQLPIRVTLMPCGFLSRYAFWFQCHVVILSGILSGLSRVVINKVYSLVILLCSFGRFTRYTFLAHLIILSWPISQSIPSSSHYGHASVSQGIPSGLPLYPHLAIHKVIPYRSSHYGHVFVSQGILSGSSHYGYTAVS